jgi:hypothetical protein
MYHEARLTKHQITNIIEIYAEKIINGDYILRIMGISKNEYVY